jgi:ubiquitin-protein ligase E3 C
MFNTFTGSGRRPRQVNLSGRNSNPFAAVQQTSRTGQPTSQNAVAQAQQERRARQVERERTNAAKSIQRVWKGHRDRRRVSEQLRRQWDEGDRKMDDDTTAKSSDQSRELQRLKLLVRFADVRSPQDVTRVCEFQQWLSSAVSCGGILSDDWSRPLGRIASWALRMLNRAQAPQSQNKLEDPQTGRLLNLSMLVWDSFPDSMISALDNYYTVLSKLVLSGHFHGQEAEVLKAVTNPLQQKQEAYESLCAAFLTTPDLDQYLNLASIAQRLNFDTLAHTLHRLSSSLSSVSSKQGILWLLAYFISFSQKHNTAQETSANIQVTKTISSLLTQVSDLIEPQGSIHNTRAQTETPRFVQNQISTLINQDGIQNLLISSGENSYDDYEEASALASYALTLLQVFPRRSNDIRMWLYMGSMSAQQSGRGEPAIKYFWNAVRNTSVYRDIYQDPSKAIRCLHESRQSQHSSTKDSDWRKILLFLELYTFVLKIMDDEEFMTGARDTSSQQSWTRQSAIPISDVIHLTVFLKNFAFAMYWHSSKILEDDEPVNADPRRIASYFGNANSVVRAKAMTKDNPKAEDTVLAGVGGMTLKYMKGMVTGLLRMLYERDSRRDFTKSKDHWLMKEFEMEGFISAVVQEQATKNDLRDEYNSDDDMIDEDDGQEGDDDHNQVSLVGTARTQNLRRMERLKRQQQREARRTMLQTVTPRLEILQNMPFFIPFAIRVEIFRQFVINDMLERRSGFVDPDQWRMSQMHQSSRGGSMMPRFDLSKHMAKVRREHIFDDAYDQFYQLGEGLKEPIQITFVDQFGSVEAGIDGGGVTKEFLTSITSEAFSPDKGFNLFIENDQHLLYPNPSALDEERERLREFGLPENSEEWREQLRELMKKYEFLGRVIGKCLYEGILVDIHFAPFFLVKWALTGGSESATNESGYRATINDLRDLDEGLYQGLVSTVLCVDLDSTDAYLAQTQELPWQRRGFFARFHHHRRLVTRSRGEVHFS